MIIVSDTSPISNLLQINRLELLHVIFGEVIIPPSVEQEILALEKFQIDLAAFHSAGWIKLRQPADLKAVNALKHDLDSGESEAIVLAQELQADWILLDERAGTQIAESLGLKPIGLVGILIIAKEKGLISSVTLVLDELRFTAGFWISDKFLSRIRALVNEA
jgi:hypothetical protein